MKLEQIRQAIEVYNTGSINRAAQALYLAQSSLSSSIKSLERELGQNIFVRSQSGISLTPFGVEFIAHGREILKHMAAIEQCVIWERRQSLGFNVAVYFLFFASRLFTDLFNEYQDESVTLNYSEDTRSAIVRGVSEGSYEIGLLTMPDMRKPQWLELMRELDLEYVRITSERPYVVMGPNCPLQNCAQPEVTLSQLHGHPFITFPESHPLFASIDEEIFRRVRPGSFITVSDRGTLTSLLSQTPSLYLAVYHPKASRDSDFFPGVRRFLLRDAPFSFEIGYIKKKGQALSFLAEQYLESVKSILLD